MNKLYQITSSYFCAGIIVNDDVIVQTAPILKNYIGMRFEDFRVCARNYRWAIHS